MSRPPIAANADPGTSHAAAAAITASGARDAQLAVVLEAVQRFPGRTSAELARDAGLNRHVPGRRLSELEERGEVYRGEERPCTATTRPGLKGVTWWPVEREPGCLF